MGKSVNKWEKRGRGRELVLENWVKIYSEVEKSFYKFLVKFCPCVIPPRNYFDYFKLCVYIPETDGTDKQEV